MKIAFVSPEFVSEENFDGGLSNYLAKVGLGLRRLGHEVTVVVRSHVDEEFDWQGIRVCRVKIGGPPFPFLNNVLREYRAVIDCLWQSWKLNRALLKLSKSIEVDIIQYASYTATALFRLKNIPSVVRLSSFDPLLREAYGVELDFPRRLLEYLESVSIKKADAVFSPSQLLSRVAGERLDISVDVIQSPFATMSGTRDSRPFAELLQGKRYLLFFGTLGRLKGVITISRMIRALLERHPDLFFVFIGKDAGYRGRPVMQEVWSQAGPCRGRVLYLGKMHQEQLVPILENATAVVLPSHIDNFPNTCVEAMFAGRVVVGTHGTSFEELLEDGVTGFLVTPDSPDELGGKVDYVLTLDSEILDGIGQNARRRAAELSGDVPLQHLVSCYKKVIAAHNTCPVSN